MMMIRRRKMKLRAGPHLPVIGLAILLGTMLALNFGRDREEASDPSSGARQRAPTLGVEAVAKEEKFYREVMSGEALDEALSMLKDQNDASNRDRAVFYLMKYLRSVNPGDVGVLNAVHEAVLVDSDTGVRSKAQHLRKLADKASFEVYLKLLSGDPSAKVRRRLAERSHRIMDQDYWMDLSGQVGEVKARATAAWRRDVLLQRLERMAGTEADGKVLRVVRRELKEARKAK